MCILLFVLADPLPHSVYLLFVLEVIPRRKRTHGRLSSWYDLKHEQKEYRVRRRMCKYEQKVYRVSMT